MSSQPALSFDIFCRVVDNFGDIGVCWRLARQLAQHPRVSRVRLWVDKLHSFRCIEPAVSTDLPVQNLDAVEIVHWTQPALRKRPYDVVVEAFGCTPPSAFLDAMVQTGSLWINLEYLSAESWVESCHGLPSLQSSGLKKYFFFPGFSTATGGLLRENRLLEDRDHWLSQPDSRLALLRSLGVADSALQVLHKGGRQLLLFCYPDAPATGLIDSLAADPKPSVVLVPAGVCPGLEETVRGPVHIARIPFTDQQTFDRLLWGSDLNLVRGEDSLVRALWAGKPLIWQIYPQSGASHLDKLEAWLERSAAAPGAAALMRNWNTGDAAGFRTGLNTALKLPNWLEWQKSSAEYTRQLAAMPPLAASLITFCTLALRKG